MRKRAVMVFLYRTNRGTLEFLLLKRTDARGGYWQPVTGHVEHGEEPTAAAIREVLEETGCRLGFVQGTHLLYFFHHNGNDYEHGVFYSLWPLYEEDVQISEEHTEYRWTSYEEAMKLLKWDDNKDALEQVYRCITKIR